MQADADAAEKITFDSHGQKIVGNLYPARYASGPSPAIVITGPMTYQKEQAPMLYARQLALMGYTTLVFDPRYRGESGGEPRNYENPRAKVEDLRAALDYLCGRGDVDADRLALLGICMGSPSVLVAAAEDDRVKVLATAAGQYRDAEADMAWLGSQEAINARLERGRKALEEYRKTGQAETVPVIDRERMDVGMPGALVWSWYQQWADQGVWTNEYAVMSDEALMTFESISAAKQLDKPWLMIHSDQAAVPDAAKRHFDAVPTKDKLMLWEGPTHHFQYYDDPQVIRRACYNVLVWFTAHGL